MDLDEISSRLSKLKRRGVNLSVKNRKEAIKEENQILHNKKPTVYSMKDDGDVGAGKEEEKDDRNKLLQYTIRDYEQWEHKKHRTSLQSSHGTNMRDLAKLTYDKEIKNLMKDGYPHDGKVSKSYGISAKGKIILKDDEKLVDKLMSSLNKTADTRYANMRKKNQKSSTADTEGGFINNKNKQFNDKLAREFKRYEDD